MKPTWLAIEYAGPAMSRPRARVSSLLGAGLLAMLAGALSCAELMMEGNCEPESTKAGELCMIGDDGAPARPARPLRAR